MSYKFIKTTDDENLFDNLNVTVEIPNGQGITLADLADAFEAFLKGCGFCGNFKVEIVEDSEEGGETNGNN